MSYTVFGHIDGNDFVKTKYTVHKQWNISTLTESSSLPTGYHVSEGIKETGSFFRTGSLNSDGTYKRSIYDLVNHMYYQYQYTASLKYGNINTTGSIHNRIILISVPQIVFGEKIKPGSIRISDNSADPAVETIVTDDYSGSLKYGNTYVGNVFYSHGNLIITNTSSLFDDFMMQTGSNGFEFGFRGTHAIYEHEVSCIVKAKDFNLTLNPSAYNPTSSAVSASALRQDILISNEWTPYITTIGLYDDGMNLLATGKLGKPVPKKKNCDTTFVIRWDT